ncbi:hypothetical protein HanRHA438_Chr02g0086641 [Helianthus annuus]|nr:hypothetical protein HanRHA438_Chr02g0086641 [Helianthus annuus]
MIKDKERYTDNESESSSDVIPRPRLRRFETKEVIPVELRSPESSGDLLSNREQNDVDVIPVVNLRRRPCDSDELRFLRSCRPVPDSIPKVWLRVLRRRVIEQRG